MAQNRKGIQSIKHTPSRRLQPACVAKLFGDKAYVIYVCHASYGRISRQGLDYPQPDIRFALDDSQEAYEFTLYDILPEVLYRQEQVMRIVVSELASIYSFYNVTRFRSVAPMVALAHVRSVRRQFAVAV